jgi:hypothetical protein
MNTARAWQRHARLLFSIATLVAPSSRRHWLSAMGNEAMYLPDRAVPNWAIGCVVAAIKMRFADMFTLKHEISRPVLMLEILICFGSIVFAGAQFTNIFFRSPSLASQLNPGVVIVAGIVVGVVGLTALAAGLRQITQGKSITGSMWPR